MTHPLPRTSKLQSSREAIGESEAFLTFQENLSQVARVDRPVLIVGERGTGKELAAQRLHFLSLRWEHPLVSLNCAALSSNLIESELFGYEAGAFTGAMKRRKGRFEAADQGTLFLDEVGRIPLEVQAKILRAVEYQSFERVGGSAPIQVDVRIVGATHQDLPALAAEGLFQQDLLDRLSFEVLNLPPLRKRMGDVALLAHFFAVRMAHELGWEEVPVFEDQALVELERYDWPGNVRELKNVVERAVYRSESQVIEEVVFNPFPRQKGKDRGRPLEKNTREIQENSLSDLEPSLDVPFVEQVRDLEVVLLEKALKISRFNQKKAADLLGLTYHQFRRLYRKHDLSSKGER